MRTTLTIDDDVATALKRIQKTHNISYKALVNQLLRQGLVEMNRSSPPKEPYQTRSVSLGRCLIGNLDDISEAFSIAEGEDYK